MSIPQDDRPYVDVICDAKSHDHPIKLDRFVCDPDRGWRWMAQRSRGGGELDAASGLRTFYDPPKRSTAFELPDGRIKVSLDCPCGLHLPIRWEHWTPLLDALRNAGETSVNLPGLVARMTK